ncbi:MAG TPA: DUF6212 domain-containing protein [Falsiroseomonas sp.]|jgi:hypothetical protein|nr:DUF6212 domain-containing protein [Falsiroseomonas sp.]
MIGLRIGAAELAEMEAGAPGVVLAPGILLPHAPPLLVLTLKEGVLVRPGGETSRSLPLPPWARLLALVGPEAAAERLLPLLPPGLPVLPDAAALLGRLAEALHEARRGADVATAERNRLKRAFATQGAPLPRRVIVLPPAAGAEPAALPLTQPLGRPAEGLCTVELHVAAPAASGLVVRLLAGAQVIGLWRVPAAALAPGWLALDLPEPAAGPATGTEDATLEVLAEPGAAPPPLSPSADHPRASLALRAWTAPPGWAVLPRHFDWAASGAPRPALPLPLPASLLAEAAVEGARVELVAAGAEPARLLLEVPPECPPGGEARLTLPATPVGPADLLRLRLMRIGAGSSPISVAIEVTGLIGKRVASGWRDVDDALALMLPLPPGPMATLSLALRHHGSAAALLELSGIALQAGAAGEPRRPPPPETSSTSRAAVMLPGTSRPSTSTPGTSTPGTSSSGASPYVQPAGWRAAPPAPRLSAAAPGGGRTAPPHAPSGAAGFQEVKVNQHLVNADGTYGHLDIGVAGLVSGGGLWRQLRLKLFDRRGAAGLEFREAKGWPQMFDIWPVGGSDNYGPFWRLDTEAAAAALAALATPHDRALIAALVDVLPDLAGRAAGIAGLAGPESELWTIRARRVAQAVAAARGIRTAG